MSVKQDIFPEESLDSTSTRQASAVVGELQQLLQSHQVPVANEIVPIHAIAEISETVELGMTYGVMLDEHQYVCDKAASCLLVPKVGDKVLVSGPDSGELYIIAIIKQAVPEQSELAVKGHLSISSEALSLHSKQLQVKADAAQCVIDSADYVGKELRSTISISRIVGKVYEVIADRLSQMSRNSFKITEQVDQTRAGTIDYQAEDSARIHSKYTMVTGKELVKVDSDQIHMG